MDQELLYWIWLAQSFSYGSPKPYAILLDYAHPADFFAERAEAAKRYHFITKSEYNLLNSHSPEDFLFVLEQCEQNDISVVTCLDACYPERLKNIDSPPVVLYVKGNLSGFSDTPCFAMVGTRNPCDYSKRVTGNLAYQFSKRGAAIISGCAVGIDSYAHMGALKADGRTVAVMGTSLEKDYPKANAALKQEILKNGALISEFPPGTNTVPLHFPIRNRLIAGLADVTIVTEAAARSGALITAEASLEQGKEVFFVPPHDIYDKRFEGAKKYLREGAGILLSADDILSIYGLHRAATGPVPQKRVLEKRERTPKQVSASVLPDAVQPKLEPILSGDATRIYDRLTSTPVGLQQLAEAIDLPISKILCALTEMEIKECITAHPGRRYSRS